MHTSQSTDDRRKQIRHAQTLDAAAIRGLVGRDRGLAGNAQPKLFRQRLSEQAWRPCSPAVSPPAQQESATMSLSLRSRDAIELGRLALEQPAIEPARP